MKSKKIVVTRAEHQAAELEAMLRERGAIPVLYPCIEIEPAGDSPAFDKGIRDVSSGLFDWIVFTSANAVLAVKMRFESLGVDVELLSGARIAAIGPGTAAAVRSMFGLDAELLPAEYEAEHLAEALSPAAGTKVFLPQSDIARPILREMLSNEGADVCFIPAYVTVIGGGGADVPGLLAAGEIDAVTFTSSSTVDNFARRLENEGSTLDSLGDVCVACLGRKTTKSAVTLGLTVAVSPPVNTIESLVSSLDDYFTKR